MQPIKITKYYAWSKIFPFHYENKCSLQCYASSVLFKRCDQDIKERKVIKIAGTEPAAFLLVIKRQPHALPC